MALTNTEVLKAIPGPSPIKMADGRGLYLLINAQDSAYLANQETQRWKTL